MLCIVHPLYSKLFDSLGCLCYAKTDFSSLIASNFISRVVDANFYQITGCVMPCMTHLMSNVIGIG